MYAYMNDTYIYIYSRELEIVAGKFGNTFKRYANICGKQKTTYARHMRDICGKQVFP